MKPPPLLPLLTALVVALVPPHAPAQDVFVSGGALFDGLEDGARPNPGLRIRAGRIVAVGAKPAEGEALLEVPDGHLILPGFFDLHAHYAVDLFGGGRVDERRAYPALFLANGVTTTFPAGEVDPHEMRALRIAIERGERIGPRILNSGPYFGRWRRGWDDEQEAQDIAREVDEWADLGARGFKAKGISPAHLEALIQAAHRRGLTVTGHLDSGARDTVNPRDAIAMGIDRIEHFLGGDALDPERPVYATLADFRPGTQAFDDIAARFIEAGVYYDATLTAYGHFGTRESEVFEDWADERRFFTPHMLELLEQREPREPMALFQTIFERKHATLRAFHDAGGAHLITAGSDHPSWGVSLAPFCIHRELHAMVNAGLPVASVLRAATLNAAQAMGVGSQFGSVEAGKFGDLLIVAGDPFEDVRATRAVWRVLKGGVVHDPAQLLRSAEGKIGPQQADEEEAWMPRGR